MRMIITGGGTGGHIYPALAIAEGMQQHDPNCEVLYVGTTQGLEKDIVPKRGIPMKTIRVEGLPRKVSPALLKAVGKAVLGCMDAKKIVKEFQPDVIVGTGGFVCGPMVLIAKLSGVPALIHEQNALPGKTNRWLSNVVDAIMVPFDEARKYFKHPERVHLTGLPVRQEITQVSKEEGLAYFGFSADKPVMLVSGGSRGARSMNLAMADAYSQLIRKDIQIIHLTGAVSYEETMARIRDNGVDLEQYPNITVRPYLDEMQYALAAADFCLGRAGATFLAEITICGLPGILIPYPFAAENHQEYNARALVDHGAAQMILDRDLTAETLMKAVNLLLDDANLRHAMSVRAKEMGRPEALEEIVALVTKHAKV